MTFGKVVAVVQKNRRESIKINLATFSACRVIGARIFVTKDNGEEVPTKDGITVRAEKLDDLIAGLQAARAAAVAEGWLPA